MDHSVIPTSAGFTLLNWHGCHHALWSSLPSNRLALNPQIHLPLVLSVRIKGGCYHIQPNRVIEHLQSSRELSTVSWRKWLRHFSQAFVDRKSLGKVPTHRPMLPALQRPFYGPPPSSHPGLRWTEHSHTEHHRPILFQGHEQAQILFFVSYIRRPI